MTSVETMLGWVSHDLLGGLGPKITLLFTVWTHKSIDSSPMVTTIRNQLYIHKFEEISSFWDFFFSSYFRIQGRSKDWYMTTTNIIV